MKKRCAFLTVVLCAVVACGLAACGKDDVRADYMGVPQADGTLHTQENWRQKIVTGAYTTTGEGVTVDGAFADGEWDESYPMTFSDTGVPVELFARFGADGVYVAYRIADDEFYYHPQREDYCNSGVDLYLAAADVETLGDSVLQLRCDTVGKIMSYRGVDRSVGLGYSWEQKYVPMFAAVGITGGLTGDDEQGYKGAGVMTVEFFVAWDALGLSAPPATIKMFPHYNYTNSAEKDARRVDSVEPFGGYDQPKSWYAFDSRGYVNSDARICEDIGFDPIVGDGALGLAKSAAWDLSDFGDGVARTVNAYDKHYLFFTDVCAENYMIEASVRHDSAAYGDALPRTGLIAAMTNTTKSSLIRPYTAFILGCGDKQRGTVRTFEEPGWVMSPDRLLSGMPGNVDPTAGFVKLTVVKLGASFHYFVNDTHMTTIASRELSQFGGETVPGLFTIGSNSTFKDISVVTELSDIRAAMRAHGLNVVTIETNEGGVVTAKAGSASFGSIGAAADGQTVTFDIRPTLSRSVMYLVTSFSVDGVERISDVRNGALKVVATGDTAVSVTFARAENTVRIEGRAFTTDLSQPLTVMRLTDITNKAVVDVYAYNGLRAETNTVAVFNFVLNDGVYRLRLAGDDVYLRVENGGYTVIDENGGTAGDGKTIFLSA